MAWAVGDFYDLFGRAKVALAIRCAMRAQEVVAQFGSYEFSTFWQSIDAVKELFAKGHQVDLKLDVNPDRSEELKYAFDVVKYAFQAADRIRIFNSPDDYFRYDWDTILSSVDLITLYAVESSINAFAKAGISGFTAEHANQATKDDLEWLRTNINSNRWIDTSETGPMGALWPMQSVRPISQDSLSQFVDSCELRFTGRIVAASKQSVVREGLANINGFDTQIAVKISRKPIRLRDADIERIRRFKKLSQHPNIVSLYDYQFERVNPESDEVRLVTINELGTTSLQERLATSHISQNELTAVLEGVAEAIDFLHSNRLIHLKVKPSNIFNIENTYKLGDIGISSLSPASDFGYYAPEILERRTASFASDVYSLAVNCLRARLGSELFWGDRKNVISQQNDPDFVAERLRTLGLASKMRQHFFSALQPDMHKRPKSAKEWFKNISAIYDLEFEEKIAKNQERSAIDFKKTLSHFLETLRAYTANEEPRW